MINEFWQWFLIAGAGIIFISNAITATVQLMKHFKSGKNNADAYFEKKVQEVVCKNQKEENERSAVEREKESKAMRDFISNEIKPIQNLLTILDERTLNLQNTAVTDLKIKLRTLYHESFEKNGVLTTYEKSNWDKWFADYSLLGGNSDVRTMNDNVQKIHLEITMAKQKEIALKQRSKKKEIKEDG